MRYFEIEFGQKEDPGFRTDNYYAEESMVIKADHWPTFEEAENFLKEEMLALGFTGVHSITEETLDEVRLSYEDEEIKRWPTLTTNDKKIIKMKIKYEVVVDNMEEFSKAHSIVEELCHLYDGIDKEKSLAFGYAASYMLNIINGEQNDSKEKKV